MAKMERLLSVNDVSKILGIHENSLYRLLHTAEIAYLRVGGLIKIQQSDLEYYLSRQRVAAIAETDPAGSPRQHDS